VCKQIRAMQPWPTPYSFLHSPGKEVTRVIVNRVGRIVLSPSGPRHPSPGSLLGLENGLWVATGANGAVEIVELQPAGKRRMSAADFLRGRPLREGDRFGLETA
jgi:methionyl-tRNA formyltransferase